MTTFTDDLLALMPHMIGFAPQASLNVSGEPTAGATVEYPGLVEQRVRMVRDVQGREVASTVSIYLVTTADIKVTDTVFLPAGFTPASPPIINRARFSDEDGASHVEVYC